MIFPNCLDTWGRYNGSVNTGYVSFNNKTKLEKNIRFVAWLNCLDFISGRKL